ncbi:pyrophosphatase PpaX [Clostridium polyendosporum]|uniref:Pyrophosphatase PpaX n=1 Tax=Clostridium polyendosporum TaxID=69208 RepID=A0A919S336_9CLOT|nr:pyrophosphatase PpaX [Clostridium polyendosporum]GIM30476.1 pyrophosphatase PpaX [Clostridium polyendosporum]
MIKAVLFDLDGTLIDTNELIFNSFSHAFKSVLNMELPQKEITTMFGRPLKYSFEKYTQDKLEEMIHSYRSYNEERHDNMCFAFDGVKDMLGKLKEMGIKLAVVTSKRKVLAERGMKIAGIYEMFDIIVSPENTEKHKPEGEPALKACELLGVLPEEALMVGDSHLDILCGQNAGCKTCGVKYTTLQIKELEARKPDFFIDNPLDVISVIEEKAV